MLGTSNGKWAETIATEHSTINMMPASNATDEEGDKLFYGFVNSQMAKDEENALKVRGRTNWSVARVFCYSATHITGERDIPLWWRPRLVELMFLNRKSCYVVEVENRIQNSPRAVLKSGSVSGK